MTRAGKLLHSNRTGLQKPRTTPFFQALGTNGRSCYTCHQPQDAWGISAKHVQERFDADSDEPLFRLIDGANCPSDDVSSPKAKRQAYSLLLNMGLVRSGIALPSSRQFEIVSVNDPYSCTTNATTGLQNSTTGKSEFPTGANTTGAVSLYRRPLPTTNIGFLSTLLWDGREPDLFSLGLHATRNRLQSITDPTDAQLQQMVTFQGCDTKNQEQSGSSMCANTRPGSGIFTAQIFDDDAKNLAAAGARGGPKALHDDLAGFFIGINDPFPGGNPMGEPFTPVVFHLYDAWADLPTSGKVNAARAAIARGQDVFNLTEINLTGVAGINDNPAINMPKSFKGACATCHDTPSAGNHSVKAPLNIGIANGPTNPPPALDISGLPVFTIECRQGPLAGQIFEVTDIGRAMISGACADIGKFKGPILRGLAARAPYFHNGGAATLLDVVNFYDGRFGIGLTNQQKSDLVAFLSSL